MLCVLLVYVLLVKFTKATVTEKNLLKGFLEFYCLKKFFLTKIFETDSVKSFLKDQNK